MELAFAEKAIRDICLNEVRAKQAYGDQIAAKLKRRLADLSAAANVAEFMQMPGNARELANEKWDQMAVSLINEHQLVFQNGHVIKEPLLGPNRIDWARVRRVKILTVEEGNE